MPYGTRSRETIRKYALQDENFLINKNVKLIIAACGTVSSVASDTASLLPVPFFEVVSHAARSAVKATKNGKIGVIGTAATVKSGEHERQIKALLPSAEVTAVGCSLFVPLVEEGWYSEDDVVVFETVKRYLKPIKENGCDTLILGCTHYPVLEKVIKKVLGDEVSLINAGTSTSQTVKEYLCENDMLNSKTDVGIHSFYVSDKADSFRTQASILLGEEIDETKVSQVDLGNL